MEKEASYTQSLCEELITKFSVFVADPGTTRHFALRCVLVHLKELKGLRCGDTFLLDKQIDYILINFHD